MTPRQAVVFTIGLLMVATMMVVVAITILAAQATPDNTPAPIVTIKSCPKTCEMLV